MAMPWPPPGPGRVPIPPLPPAPVPGQRPAAPFRGPQGFPTGRSVAPTDPALRPMLPASSSMKYWVMIGAVLLASGLTMVLIGYVMMSAQ